MATYSFRVLYRYHIDCCVTMYNEKAQNPVQTWLLGFSARCRYTTFSMASFRQGKISHAQRSMYHRIVYTKNTANTTTTKHPLWVGVRSEATDSAGKNSAFRIP